MILNPGAGQGQGVEQLRRLASQREIRVRQTRGGGDARRLARAAVDAGEQLLIVVGGDGTLSEAVNGLAPDFGALRLLIQRGSEIHVEATPRMAFISDGEHVSHTPVTFRVIPGALRALAPTESA